MYLENSGNVWTFKNANQREGTGQVKEKKWNEWLKGEFVKNLLPCDFARLFSFTKQLIYQSLANTRKDILKEYTN